MKFPRLSSSSSPSLFSRFYHVSRPTFISTHVSTLEYAAKHWAPSPRNPNLTSKSPIAAFARSNLNSAIELLRQSRSTSSAGTSLLVSPLSAGLAAGSNSELLESHKKLQLANTELSSYSLTDSQRLQFRAFLSPRFTLAQPKSPAWFINSANENFSSSMLIRTGKLFYSESKHYQLVDIPYISSDYVFTILSPRSFPDPTIADHPQPHRYNPLPRVKTTIQELFDSKELLNSNNLFSELEGMDFMSGTVALPAFTVSSSAGEFQISDAGITEKARALRVRLQSVYPRFFISCHRPFIFFLRHPSSGVVLLAGSVERVAEKSFKSKYGNIKDRWIESYSKN